MAVRIGFVGTGGVSKGHIEALSEIEGAQVVACMDVDADRAAEAAAGIPGAGAYGDLTEMLDAQELDAVYICVPPHAHGDIELTLIDRGIPFFLEKPIGIDREAPRRILEALKGKDLVTSVGYVYRYLESVRRAKEHLEQDAPVVARGGFIGGLPGVFWWRRKELSGGQIIEQTTHIYDVARYLFGEVTSVFCKGRKGLVTDVEDYDVADASICLLSFESGLACEITSSCVVEKGEVFIEVFSRKSRVKVSWTNLTVMKGEETLEIAGTDDPFRLEDRAFVKAVSTGDGSCIKSTYEDAFRTQMVCCAANESMESGQPVSP